MDDEYLNWLEFDAYTLVPPTGKENIVRSHFVF